MKRDILKNFSMGSLVSFPFIEILCVLHYFKSLHLRLFIKTLQAKVIHLSNSMIEEYWLIQQPDLVRCIQLIFQNWIKLVILEQMIPYGILEIYLRKEFEFFIQSSNIALKYFRLELSGWKCSTVKLQP